MASRHEHWNRKGRGRWIRDAKRFAIYARDGFDCIYCRGVFPIRTDGAGLTLDHVIPRSAGGGNGVDNVVTACWGCNSSMQDAPRTALQLRRAAAAIRKPLDISAGKFYYSHRRSGLYVKYEAQTEIAEICG